MDAVFDDKLLTEEIDSLDGVLLNNKVLVEVEDFIYDSVKTKSGLSLWVDNTEQIAQYAVRHGRVVKLPQRLVFWDESKQGMSWRTTIQCEIGDLVWFYAMTSFDGEKLSLNGRKFILISYDDLYVAKRGEEVIMLNANVLLEPIYTPVKALSFESNTIDPLYAKIAYIGQINTEYQVPFIEDDTNLKQGMTVLMSGMPYRFLEREPYLMFDGKLNYIVAQNHEIKAYLT